ncbi:MAG: WD40/YVTN/BNR-like repeat-containing protein, partial [Mucilaginibacter sp.]
LSPGHGWHFSACTPFAFSPQAFCKLSSGRLFVSFVSGKSYLRYSDDNGGSWNAAKSLGKHEFQYVMSTPADELFAVAMDGNYYSKDGGQTWTSLGMQVFNTKMVTGIVYTATGKLLVSTRFDPLFISLDMGKTWTAVPSSAITFPNSTSANSEFYDPLEDKDGNLYIEAQDSQTIYKSADVGKTWSIISGSNELDVAFYIDNNNWLYKCINQGNSGEIAISKDKGVSYTQLIIPQYIFVNNMSVQSDGNFYFSVSGSGVFKANGISSSVKKIYDNEASQFTPYIVAKNNNIVAGNAQGWISYYTQ